MKIRELIEKKIKQKFGNKGKFCKKMGYDFKGFSKKLDTFENKAIWINEFLKPLGLKQQIIEEIEVDIEKKSEN